MYAFPCNHSTTEILITLLLVQLSVTCRSSSWNMSYEPRYLCLIIQFYSRYDKRLKFEWIVNRNKLVLRKSVGTYHVRQCDLHTMRQYNILNSPSFLFPNFVTNDGYYWFSLSEHHEVSTFCIIFRYQAIKLKRKKHVKKLNVLTETKTIK